MRNGSRTFVIITVALGFFALLPLTKAVSPAPDGGYPGGNTAEGQNALLGLTTGGYNTAIGYLCLRSNTISSFNTAIGAGALFANTSGSNTATGAGALLSNGTGTNNTATGAFAIASNTGGDSNTAVGAAALYSNSTGAGNTAVGSSALPNCTGGFNTALGNFAGSNLTTGENNIDIGYNVQGVQGESNTIRIGDSDITDAYIRGISGTTVASGATVLVASNGHLGTVTSSKRFKRDIRPMDKASEALFSLKPVSFRYKKEIDPTDTQQFGLVAEDVAKVDPNLVVRDEQGKISSVRYEQVNAMLLNEFLKEHRKVEQQDRKIREQQGTIACQQKQIDDLATGLEKVSTELQLNRSPARTVANESTADL